MIGADRTWQHRAAHAVSPWAWRDRHLRVFGFVVAALIVAGFVVRAVSGQYVEGVVEVLFAMAFVAVAWRTIVRHRSSLMAAPAEA